MTFVGSLVFFFSQNDLDVERCFWEVSLVTDFFPQSPLPNMIFYQLQYYWVVLCKIIYEYGKSIPPQPKLHIHFGKSDCTNKTFFQAVFLGTLKLFLSVGFLSSDLVPSSVLWFTVTHWREKNVPYTCCDNHLADRMNDGVLKYCTENALKEDPWGPRSRAASPQKTSWLSVQPKSED